MKYNNKIKLATVFIIVVTLLLFGSVFVDAALNIKDSFSKTKTTFTKIKNDYLKQTRLLSYAAVFIALLLISMLSPLKNYLSDSGQKYIMWGLILVAAILITNSSLGTKNEYIWQQPFVLEGKTVLFGCDKNEPKINCVQYNGKKGAYIYKNDPTDDNYGILVTGEKGRGLPAFIAAFISLLFVFIIFKDKLGIPEGFYIEYLIPALLAFSFANDGMEKGIAVMVGGWGVLLALNFNLQHNMNMEKSSGFIFGLAFAFVQIAVTNIDSGASLIYLSIFDSPSSSTAILGWLIIGVIIGYVKNFISKGGTDRWGNESNNLSPVEKEKINSLAREGHPGKALLVKKLGILSWWIKTDQQKLDENYASSIIKKISEVTGIAQSEIKKQGWNNVYAGLSRDEIKDNTGKVIKSSPFEEVTLFMRRAEEARKIKVTATAPANKPDYGSASDFGDDNEFDAYDPAYA